MQNTDSIFFSVVIPSYNRAHLIEKTLMSVFEQSYKFYEIIVVDNCSTDNTIEVLQPYVQSGRIRLIKNEVNLERSVSRNNGMKAAKGDFLTLLDSDDLMHKDNLHDAAAFIRENPDIKFFHNLFHLVNENGEVIYTPRVRDNKTAVKSISYGNFLGCIGVFLAREVYQQYHFDENPVVIGSEDWDLWIRIISRYPVGRISKINNSVVEHGARSISTFTPDSILQRRIYILNKIRNNPDLRSVYAKYLSVMEASGYVLAASTANAARAFKAGKKYILRALYTNPLLIFDLPFLRVIYLNVVGTVFNRKNKSI